jgi:hypothetical protein
MLTNFSRLAAMLAVLMLGMGACCCQGALLAELVRPEHACCSKKSDPAHKKDCRCSGQVLSEGKTDSLSIGSIASAVSPPAWSGVEPFVFCPAPRTASHISAKAHAPPREARSRLQVWLI